MKKTFVGLVSAITLSAGILPLGVLGQSMSDQKYFDLDQSQSNYQAVMALSADGILQGYPDGSFQPNAKVNRAEFMKIVSALAKAPVQDCLAESTAPKAFSDVPAQEWFAPYVCWGQKTGFLKGYSDGSFQPARNITTAEAAKLILLADGTNVDESGTNWYTNYLLQLEERNAIPRTIESQHSELTRAQAAEMIWRVSKKIVNQDSQTLSELEAPGFPTANTAELQTAATFPKIASCLDLKAKLDEVSSRENDYYIMEEAMPLAAPAESTKATSDSSAGGANTLVQDFSQTNTQVQGVDEADIVKNDGQYIYHVRNGRVAITKAYPAKNMVQLAELKLADQNFWAQELYIAGDKLVVIGNSDYYIPYSEPAVTEPLVDAKIAPGPYYGGSRSKAYIVDIADKTNPKIEREVAIDASYMSSRRVGDYVYLVLNKYNYSYIRPYQTLAEDTTATNLAAKDLLPVFIDNNGPDSDLNEKALIACDQVHYFPGFNNSNYLVVAGLPINDSKKEIEREVILGASENIYSSAKNLYVASTEYNYPVWNPPLIEDSSDPTPIVADPIIPEEREETVVYKFNLNQGKVSFDEVGKAPGRILNQFSMDESGNNFRIATTKGDFWNDQNPSTNNLYVFDENMKIVGELTDIAPGERIFSTRFMGDRLYMVTFKNVDPLFVIDLKDPKNPKILGKLKIPGYSDYLHPYDENHIIGFGKDAVSAKDQNGEFTQFAWYQGMKMAMFDVTNVNEPKEMFVEMIGDRGTQSDLLYDHKALLFDKEKNLLAFPISVAELTDEQKAQNDGSEYGSTVFQGAYVYSVNLTDGFKLRAKISHYADPDVFTKAGEYFYGEYGLNIQRILYIGEYLYSVSPDLIKAYNLQTLNEENSVEFKDAA